MFWPIDALPARAVAASVRGWHRLLPQRMTYVCPGVRSWNAIKAIEPTTKPVAQSVDHALAERLRAALLALPAELVEGKTREIVKRGKTLGHVVLEVRHLRVDVHDEHGKVVRIPVANTRDVSKAVKALMTVDAGHARETPMVAT